MNALSMYSILLPLLSGLFYFKKLNNPFRFLLLFFLISAFVEFGANYMAKNQGNNMPLLHLFTLLEVTSYALAFRLVFPSVRLFTSLCLVVIFAQFILFGVDISILGGIYQFPTLARTAGAFMLILLSLYQLLIIFKFTNDAELFKRPQFWLLFGVLSYFCSIIFFLLLANISLNTDAEMFKLIHLFHAIVNILCNFIFAYSFLCFRFKSL